jgi:DNA-3-methyladenine glycosylase
VERLPREFYEQDTLDAARNLLGKYLVHQTNNGELTGMIVETEAYIGPGDKAAHSFNYKRTARNEVMYGPPGFAYVFLIYGMYYCMNIVTGGIGRPEAVLIRALEPIKGMAAMAKKRYQKEYASLNKSSRLNLTNGPGKLCKALEIGMSINGCDLCSSSLFVSKGSEPSNFSIETSPRINIDYAGEARYYPWRYYIKDNPYVSKSR